MKTMKTVLGVFDDKTNAEDAIGKLKDEGYDAKDISIIMRNREEAGAMGANTGTNAGTGAVSGATTGAMIGGIAGLLVGVGAIAIPGIGAILIGGPLAAALGLTGAAATTVSGAVTGAVAGGLLGGLLGLGVPEEDARAYESRVREGAILIAVPAHEGEEDEVVGILEDFDATNVRAIALKHDFHAEDTHEGKRGSARKEYKHVRSRSHEEHKFANPVKVERFLRDVDFPATKDDLIDTAKDEGAGDDVINTLQAIDDREFRSAKDVARAIGRIE